MPKLLTIAASFDQGITDRSMDNRSDIWRGIDTIKGRFIDLSDQGLGHARSVLHRGAVRRRASH